MQVIRNEALLAQLLAQHNIPARFDTQGLRFRLLRYEKGELLTGPDRPLQDLLFLVRGSVSIYALRDTAAVAPISLAKPLTLLGDIEFSRRHGSLFYAQAKTRVLCVALSLTQYRAALLQDPKFLFTLLGSVEDKLYLCVQMDVPNTPLRERVLLYLAQLTPDGRLCGVEAATNSLHCSRRQLQRVLAELCEEGQVVKTGRGCYRLPFSPV